MKGKDLKQAKLFQVDLDIVRPLTFDFNALAELQELGYENPYVALAGLENMRLKAIKALVYSGLVAGQLAEDENVPMDLSIHKVGQLLGSFMTHDPKAFNKIFEIIGEAIKDFFPDDTDEEKKDDAVSLEEDPKN